MSDPLYAKDLLRLAAAATGAGRLDPCDAFGDARNPVCGDRIRVTMNLQEGRILALAHETLACVLTQASASLLGSALTGADSGTVGRLQEQVVRMLQGGDAPDPPFDAYQTLMGAAVYRNRHRCVLLPIDAVLKAFTSAGTWPSSDPDRQ